MEMAKIVDDEATWNDVNDSSYQAVNFSNIFVGCFADDLYYRWQWKQRLSTGQDKRTKLTSSTSCPGKWDMMMVVVDNFTPVLERKTIIVYYEDFCPLIDFCGLEKKLLKEITRIFIMWCDDLLVCNVCVMCAVRLLSSGKDGVVIAA